jgi:hypothetical protein
MKVPCGADDEEIVSGKEGDIGDGCAEFDGEINDGGIQEGTLILDWD